MQCTHFVGFKGDEFNRAKAVFGPPHFIHRHWDGRAKSMAIPGDRIVFATGTAADTPQVYSFDDSEVF